MVKKKKLLKEDISTFGALLLARYILKKYKGVPKENLLHYTAEGFKDLFIGFVKYLNNYGYSVDIDMLEYRFDDMLRIALDKIRGQEYKEDGFDRYSWSNYFGDDDELKNPLTKESKRIVKLTESDLTRIVKKVIKEQLDNTNPKLSRLKGMILKKYPSAAFIDGYADEELIIHTSTYDEGSTSSVSGVYITLPSNEGDEADFVWGNYTEILDQDGEPQDTDSSIDYGGNYDDILHYLGKYLKGAGEPYIE